MTGIRHDVRNGFRENGSRLLRSIHTQIKVVHGILRSRLRFLRNRLCGLLHFLRRLCLGSVHPKVKTKGIRSGVLLLTSASKHGKRILLLCTVFLFYTLQGDRFPESQTGLPNNCEKGSELDWVNPKGSFCD